MQWAFMTANYVGRALGYANNTDWMANHRATVEAFHGPQFGTRFVEMIDDITAADFDAIELWVAHLYTGAVTIEHEPYDHDPTEACALSLKRAAAWWAEIEGAE